jgi:hypothetical protein
MKWFPVSLSRFQVWRTAKVFNETRCRIQIPRPDMLDIIVVRKKARYARFPAAPAGNVRIQSTQ